MFWHKNSFIVKVIFCLLCIIFFIPCFVLSVYAEQTKEAPEGNHTIWLAGDLPEGSTVKGNWEWDEVLTHDGARTHVQSAAGQISRHSCRASSSTALDKNSSIVQYVYLDPKNIPSGIMLKLFLASNEEIIFYWEGYEEPFAELDEYINAWYMGFMPDAGSWVELIIDFKELDMPKAELLGIEFILSEGRAWWGRTVIKSSG